MKWIIFGFLIWSIRELIDLSLIDAFMNAIGIAAIYYLITTILRLISLILIGVLILAVAVGI